MHAYTPFPKARWVRASMLLGKFGPQVASAYPPRADSGAYMPCNVQAHLPTSVCFTQLRAHGCWHQYHECRCRLCLILSQVVAHKNVQTTIVTQAYEGSALACGYLFYASKNGGLISMQRRGEVMAPGTAIQPKEHLARIRS